MIYYDITGSSGCIGVICGDEKVVFTGTSINTISPRDNNEEYKRYAKEYDIHFITKDNFPVVDIYTIPAFEIFAQDSNGGLIGIISHLYDTAGNYPVYYISPDKHCYVIHNIAAEFFKNPTSWKDNLIPDDSIKLYNSKEEAKKELDIKNFTDLLTEEINLSQHKSV